MYWKDMYIYIYIYMEMDHIKKEFSMKTKNGKKLVTNVMAVSSFS